MLLCNDGSYWLGASLVSALILHTSSTSMIRINLYGQTFVKCEQKYNFLFSRKCIWKYHMQNGGYSVDTLKCIFLNELFWIMNIIQLKYIGKDLIDKKIQFRLWLGAFRQLAIIWSNVDQDAYGVTRTLYQCKDHLSRCGNCIDKDKTIMRLSYLYHGDPYTVNTWHVYIETFFRPQWVDKEFI